MMIRRPKGLRVFPLLIFVLFVSASRAVEVPVRQEDMTPRWTPSVYAGTKIGNKRIIGQFGALGPIYQDEGSLLFMDIRGRVDDKSYGEGNFGLAYRRILGDDRFMLGGYGYFDVMRSSEGEPFVQGTLGLEFNTEYWSLRGNGYIPEDRDQVLSYTGTLDEGAQIIGNRVQIVSGLGPALVERSIPGFDVEIGRRFPLFNQDLWLYAAYYRFDSSGIETVEGPRLRADFDFDLSRWMKNATFVVGGEWQQDDVRGSQGYGTLEFRYAFGGDKAKGVRREAKERWTDRRMVSRIVRDIDIVTSTLVTGDEQSEELARNPVTGEVYGEIVFVSKDGTPGASGTPEDPAILDEAADKVGANGVIFVAGDTAETPIQTAGVNLDNRPSHAGVQLVGGGTVFDSMASDGSLYRFFTPGEPPVLEPDATLLAECTPMASLTAGDCAIVDATGVSDLRIAGLKLSGGGMLLKDLVGAPSLAAISIDKSEVEGVAITGGGGDLFIESLTITESAKAAVALTATTSRVDFVNLLVDNSKSTGPGLVTTNAVDIAVVGSSGIAAANTVIDVTNDTGDKTNLALFFVELQGDIADDSNGITIENATGGLSVESARIHHDAAASGGSGIHISDSSLEAQFINGLDLKGGDHGVVLSDFDCVSEEQCVERFSVLGVGSISDTNLSAMRVENSEAPVGTIFRLDNGVGEPVIFEGRLSISNALLDTSGSTEPFSAAIELRDNEGSFTMTGEITTDSEEESSVGLSGVNVSSVTLLGTSGSSDPFIVQGFGGGAIRLEGVESVGMGEFEVRDIGDGLGKAAIYIENATDQVLITNDSSNAGGRNTIENIAGDGIHITNTLPIDDLEIDVFFSDFADIGRTAIRTDQGASPSPFAPPTRRLTVSIGSNTVTNVGDDAIVADYTQGADQLQMEDFSLNISNNAIQEVEGTGIAVRASAGLNNSVDIENNVVFGLCNLGDLGSCTFLGARGAFQIGAIDFLNTRRLVHAAADELADTGVSVTIEGASADQGTNFLDARRELLEEGTSDFLAIRQDVLVPPTPSLDVNVQSNNVRDWSVAGIAIESAVTALVPWEAPAQIDANTIESVTGRGIHVSTGDKLELYSTLSNNTLTGTRGVLLDAETGGIIGGDFRSNTLKKLSTSSMPTFRLDRGNSVSFSVVCPAGLVSENDPCLEPLIDAKDFAEILTVVPGSENGLVTIGTDGVEQPREFVTEEQADIEPGGVDFTLVESIPTVPPPPTP